MRKHLINGLAGMVVGFSSLFGNGYAQIPSPQRVQPQLEERLTEEINSENEEKYAVIINGSQIDHTNVVQSTYEVFTRDLEYKPENIVVLSYVIPQNVSSDSIVGQASKENVIATMSYLSQITDKNDLTYVRVTGHGKGHNKSHDYKSWMILGNALPTNNWKNEVNTIYESAIKGDEAKKQWIINNHMNENEFALAVASIEGQIIADFDQCYGGGFCYPLMSLPINIITFSASDRQHASICLPYNEGFYEGLHKHFADSNHDGKITLSELRNYMQMKSKSYENRHKNHYLRSNCNTRGYMIASPTSAKPEEIILK